MAEHAHSSLAVFLVIAFVVTVPVNRAMIARGRGHAVVHPVSTTDNPRYRRSSSTSPWVP